MVYFYDPFNFICLHEEKSTRRDETTRVYNLNISSTLTT